MTRRQNRAMRSGNNGSPLILYLSCENWKQNLQIAKLLYQNTADTQGFWGPWGSGTLGVVPSFCQLG